MNRRQKIVKDKDELEEKFDQYIGGGVSGLDEKDETRYPSRIFDQSRISKQSEMNVSNNDSKLINNSSTRNIQLGAGKNQPKLLNDLGDTDDHTNNLSAF